MVGVLGTNLAILGNNGDIDIWVDLVRLADTGKLVRWCVSFNSKLRGVGNQIRGGAPIDPMENSEIRERNPGRGFRKQLLPLHRWGI